VRPSQSTNQVRDTHFQNKRLGTLGVEIISLDNLRKKMPEKLLAQPERIDFFMLMYVTSGKGALSSVRESDLKALLEWQTCSQLSADLSSEVTDSITRLSKDLTHFDESDLEVSLIRHELFVLILRIARWQRSLTNSRGVQSHHLETHRIFLRELESRFRTSHSLKFYAERLGYSQSTLSRACLAAEGRTAKRVIDRRIVLEGQRMLVHSTLSIAEISHFLGFSETTNFIKFFRCIADVTPVKFRQQRSAIS
jgi:AraC-like DNA-binding protein